MLARFIQVLTNIVLTLLILVSVSIYFLWRYPLELLSHFRVYYFLLLAGLTIALLIAWRLGLKWKVSLYLSLAALMFNSTFIIPWYLPNNFLGQEKDFRILEFNINTQNQQWDVISFSILSQKPDVAILIEISAEAMQELESRLEEVLPFSYRTTGGGLAIFSRFPLSFNQSRKMAQSTVLISDFQVGVQKIHLIATHPIIPLGFSRFTRRNAELAAITDYIQTHQDENLLLVGDFNVTPWSPYYRRLVQKTSLHNTRQGFGIEPSWIEEATYVHYPKFITRTVKLPIDHIFVSRNFKVVNCKTYKGGNSDHRILVSDLSLS